MKQLYEAMKHQPKEVVDQCLALFKIRFASDYKALMEGKEYPLSYFNEWCDRIKTGEAMGYADLETQRALKKIGVK